MFCVLDAFCPEPPIICLYLDDCQPPVQKASIFPAQGDAVAVIGAWQGGVPKLVESHMNLRKRWRRRRRKQMSRKRGEKGVVKESSTWCRGDTNSMPGAFCTLWTSSSWSTRTAWFSIAFHFHFFGSVTLHICSAENAPSIYYGNVFCLKKEKLIMSIFKQYLIKHINCILGLFHSGDAA